jgi:hypothetical protein
MDSCGLSDYDGRCYRSLPKLFASKRRSCLPRSTLCILAPAAAFAFSTNPHVAHCLTEGHVGVHDHGKAHLHADGTAHHHDHDGAAPPSGDDEKSRVAGCCSLFSVVAIPSEPGLSLGLYNPASIVLPLLADALSGRGPERINRPPIA